MARLRALQERARDEQAERDALRAKRAQEQAEREWRQKEAEEMRMKAETEAMLKKARAEQMEQKEHFLAVQAQRERADFERVLMYVCMEPCQYVSFLCAYSTYTFTERDIENRI